MMKNIAVLGSTGSIGTQALDIIRLNPDMRVTALAALSNIELLFVQIAEFKPELVCVYDKERAWELEKRLKSEFSSGKLERIPKVVSGMEGLVSASKYAASDIVVAAIVGMIGIRPIVAAINAGKDIALANKETLVCAGHIIMPLAKEKGVNIFPVDSEHSAIFQCLQGKADNKIRKFLLTASGGPFLHTPKEKLKEVTLESALKHPNWSMGAKITIDSSTIVNKGLEVCEAVWLFDVPAHKIEVIIQPQSIIHSAVEFEDGGIIAQMGIPDMKLPISYALTYPERRFVSDKYTDLFAISKLDFIKPDFEKFKGLALAFRAIEEGGSMPTVFNAANEAAVGLFLERKIGYLDIVDIIEQKMDEHSNVSTPSLDDIEELQSEIFEKIKKLK